MRLDDDSSLLSCIDYDLFQFMRDNDLAYGYRQLAFDFPRVAQPIWNMSFEYLESKSIPKTEMFMNHQKNHRWDCLAPLQQLSDFKAVVLDVARGSILALSCRFLRHSVHGPY